MNYRNGCVNHPGCYAPREHEGKRLCWSCWKSLGINTTVRSYGNRAFATGLGSQAHAEAQESWRMQREYDEQKPYSKERGGYL